MSESSKWKGGAKPKNSAENKRARAYVFLHQRDEQNPDKTNVLLGKERFIHKKALRELKEKLSGARAASQRMALVSLLKSGAPIVNDVGQCKAYGPWAGRNFGGTLLIGRAALPGGRVERSDESIERAAVRELFEEYQISPALFIGLAVNAEEKIANALKLFCVVEHSRDKEWYYTLDVEDLRDEEHPQAYNALSLDSVLLNFDEGDVECEKRSLLVCDAEDLASHFGSEMCAEDEAAMMPALNELAHTVCTEVLEIDAESREVCEAHLSAELLRFQRSRQMRSALTACDAFSAWIRVRNAEE